MKYLKKYSFNENKRGSIKMYTGVSLKNWNSIWKGKKLINKLTNITSDFDFALDYSYDFETGEYDDIVVEIDNIPLDAFMYYRYEDYEDDDDIISMIDMSEK